MEKKSYEKLNSYLNDIFLTLNIEDQFLIKNIELILNLNDDFLTFISEYELEDYTQENKLTFMDVYLLAREIIASIDHTYLSEYDDLIKSGKLDFGYEGEYVDSEFIHKDNLINICREFNYNDVLSLVHEFMHYTNAKSKMSQNQYLLTEFISIYFEIYALDYLLKMGVSKDEIGIYDRLNWAFEGSDSLFSYELVFLAYEKFGSISEDTVDYLNNYCMFEMPKEYFDEECENLLECIMNKEKKYRVNIRHKKAFEIEEFLYEFCSSFFDDYRYFLGTIMAFYARKNCEMEDIVYLNNHINDDGIGAIDLLEVLKSIGINLEDSKFSNQALNSIENYIDEYSNKKIR